MNYFQVGIFILFLIMLTSCAPQVQQVSRETDFNFGWKFSLEGQKDGWKVGTDDSNWRTLNLPHDWVVENAPDSTFDFWQATGRIPGKGIGWYRKSFPTEISEDEVCYILFDGVYNNATVWINGQQLGFHPYGYSPFYYDVTPYLNRDGNPNVLAVKVDHTRYADSRWYTGAGIYRNVRLIQTHKVHVPVWGMFVTTPEVAAEQAKVQVAVTVKNQTGEEVGGALRTVIYDPSGKLLTEQDTEFSLTDTRKFFPQFDIHQPMLWDTEHPHLYKAVSSVILNGKMVDTHEVTFGIRSIRFDANEGFFLNGQTTHIKGVCLHHDGGLVGAAVPKGVWRRRLEILKTGGCNAIRSAHNPASDEFLDLCDEMGFLVQDEFFDEWDNPKDKRFNMNEQSVHEETQGYVEHFQTWAETDIKTTMLSHRNHPSIIQWSIGNEIEWTYPRNQKATGFFDNMNWTGNYFWSEPPFSPEKIKATLESLPKAKYDIGETAQKLAEWTRQYDTTRPVTANCILPSVSHVNGYADALDMIGYSYRRVLYEYGHKNYPNIPIMGTENVPQYHEWKAVMDNPHIAGTFLWTGIEYMGEVRGDWPARSNGSGMLDLAGFKKPAYYMYKSLWSDEPHVYMTTNVYDQIQYGGKQLYTVNTELEVEEARPGAWKQFVWGWQSVNAHWNYQPNDTIIIEVLTNCPEVELFLNEQSLGVKQLTDFEDHIMKWAVPYQAGELKAVGTHGTDEVLFTYQTSGTADQIAGKLDKPILQADGYDVAHIEIQLLDKKGIPSQDDRLLTLEISDKLRLLGVDNGDSQSAQPFQSHQIKTANGRALVIVQAKRQAGVGEILIKGKDLPDEKISINLKR